MSVGARVHRIILLFLLFNPHYAAAGDDLPFVNDCDFFLSGLFTQGVSPAFEYEMFWYDLDPLQVTENGTPTHSPFSVDTYYWAKGEGAIIQRKKYRDKALGTVNWAPFQARGDILRTINAGYRKQYDKTAIPKAIWTTEDSLFAERMNYGMVYANRQILVGSLLVYDGTPSHYASDPATPAENMLKAQSIEPTSIIDLRRNNPNAPLFEIGNYFITQYTAGNMRDVAKAALLKVLLEKFVKRFPQAHYIIHVASEENKRLFEILFGFETIQTIKIQNTANTEMILSIDAAAFELKLEAVIKNLYAKSVEDSSVKKRTDSTGRQIKAETSEPIDPVLEEQLFPKSPSDEWIWRKYLGRLDQEIERYLRDDDWTNPDLETGMR